MRYTIAMLKGDQYRMDRIVALARGKLMARNTGSLMPRLSRLARSGRLQAARHSSNRAVDLLLQEGDREAAASYLAARAVWEALCGMLPKEKGTPLSALDLFPGPGRSIRSRFSTVLSRETLLDLSRSPSIWKSVSRRILL